MMKKAGRVLAILLAILLTLGCALGCSSRGKTLMKLDGKTLSVNLYQLFLSRMKGTLSSSYYFGETAASDSFWDTWMSATGKTYDDYYCEQVLESAKSYLAAIYAFDQEGLTLPDSYIEEIDAQLKELIEYDADGSKSTFNSILAPFGVNYKLLREAYIIEAKIAYLNDYLFGSDGSKISALLLDDYYKANYARYKQIVFYNFDYVYVTDDNGDNVYYKPGGDRICYDTTAQTKLDEAGKTITDVNGDYVRYTDDGKIAYDKEQGELHIVYENNAPLTRELTTEELISMEDTITLVMEQAAEGNYSLFDSLVEKYTDDTEGIATYPNGYYMRDMPSDVIPQELIDGVFDLAVGQIGRVNSEDFGTAVIMRYELEAEGYAMESNADFFVSNQTGKYVFLEDLKNQLFTEYLKPYKEQIVVNEALLETVSMKSVGVNSYY